MNNDLKSQYYTDSIIRQKINDLLHQNAILEGDLGKDSTRKQYANTKVKQERLFEQIKQLDLEFYKIIVPQDERI